MEFTELLYKRKSIRDFTDQNVTDDQIKLLLESATRAPNACNYQSWYFYAVANKEMINAFYPEIYSGKWITAAPLIIVVCTDGDKLENKFGGRGSQLFAVQDTAAAINNILLQAANIGLGGCWIGAYNDDKCRELLNIKDNHRPVALLPIGVPKSDPAPRERRLLNDVITIIK